VAICVRRRKWNQTKASAGWELLARRVRTRLRGVRHVGMPVSGHPYGIRQGVPSAGGVFPAQTQAHPSSSAQRRISAGTGRVPDARTALCRPVSRQPAPAWPAVPNAPRGEGGSPRLPGVVPCSSGSTCSLLRAPIWPTRGRRTASPGRSRKPARVRSGRTFPRGGRRSPPNGRHDDRRDRNSGNLSPAPPGPVQLPPHDAVDGPQHRPQQPPDPHPFSRYPRGHRPGLL
jgi:hypothetical protein